MDTVELEDLRIDCVVGVLEREQRATQRLRVDLAMTLDLRRAGETGDLSASVDYAAVASWLRMISEHGRFRLIESLGLAACRLLLAPPLPGEGRAPITAVELRIRKPEILAPLTTPGICLRRAGAEALTTIEVAPGVWAETLVDLPQGGAWRVRCDTGATWTPGPDLAIEVICGRFTSDERTLRPGERLGRDALPLRAAVSSGLLVVGRWV